MTGESERSGGSVRMVVPKDGGSLRMGGSLGNKGAAGIGGGASMGTARWDPEELGVPGVGRGGCKARGSLRPGPGGGDAAGGGVCGGRYHPGGGGRYGGGREGPVPGGGQYWGGVGGGRSRVPHPAEVGGMRHVCTERRPEPRAAPPPPLPSARGRARCPVPAALTCRSPRRADTRR